MPAPTDTARMLLAARPDRAGPAAATPQPVQDPPGAQIAHRHVLITEVAQSVIAPFRVWRALVCMSARYHAILEPPGQV